MDTYFFSKAKCICIFVHNVKAVCVKLKIDALLHNAVFTSIYIFAQTATAMQCAIHICAAACYFLPEANAQLPG